MSKGWVLKGVTNIGRFGLGMSKSKEEVKVLNEVIENLEKEGRE